MKQLTITITIKSEDDLKNITEENPGLVNLFRRRIMDTFKLKYGDRLEIKIGKTLW